MMIYLLIIVNILLSVVFKNSCSAPSNINFLKIFYENDRFNFTKFEDFVNDIHQQSTETFHQLYCENVTSHNSSIENDLNNYSLTINNVTNIIGIKNFEKECPVILYKIYEKYCLKAESNINKILVTNHQKPTPIQVWGYSILCVTLINLCALLGMLFLPLMDKQYYKKILMFMVALAVGTLSGSSIFVLIPEALGLTQQNSPHKETYLYRCLTVIGGLYLFFLIERLLKFIMECRERLYSDGNTDDIPTCSIKTKQIHRQQSLNMSFEIPHKSIEDSRRRRSSHRESNVSCGDGDKQVHHNEVIEFYLPNEVEHTFCCFKKNFKNKLHQSILNSHHDKINDTRTTDIQELDEIIDLESPKSSLNNRTIIKLEKIKPVAWMIVFGDGLHNFMDGLSIGAAFAGSIFAGLSISVAVICEELPHELGDFAVLLNSGMTVKQAMTCNFLSACTCYLGLICGILIGEKSSTGAFWVFALTGGMFLYIALVDMLPEVNAAAEAETKARGNRTSLQTFILQNIGLLLGFAIIFMLSAFAESISFE